MGARARRRVSVPVSIFVMKQIANKSKGRFIAQWRHTGSLNAQVEETFTGHTVVKAFGRQREAQARFDATNEELYEAGFAAQFISGCIQPATVLIGNLNYVAIAVLGGLMVAERLAGHRRRAGVHPVLAAVRRSRSPRPRRCINVLQSGIASAERVFELLDAPEQSPDPDVDPTASGRPRLGPRARRVQRRVVPLPRRHARSSTT